MGKNIWENYSRKCCIKKLREKILRKYSRKYSEKIFQKIFQKMLHKFWTTFPHLPTPPRFLRHPLATLLQDPSPYYTLPHVQHSCRAYGGPQYIAACATLFYTLPHVQHCLRAYVTYSKQLCICYIIQQLCWNTLHLDLGTLRASDIKRHDYTEVDNGLFNIFRHF